MRTLMGWECHACPAGTKSSRWRMVNRLSVKVSAPRMSGSSVWSLGCLDCPGKAHGGAWRRGVFQQPVSANVSPHCRSHQSSETEKSAVRTSTIPSLALELLSEVGMRARQLDLTGGGNAELVAHLIGSFYGAQHVANTDQCSFGLWALGLLHLNSHPLGRDRAVLGGKFDSLPGHVDVVDLLFQHIVGQRRTAPPSACPGVQQVHAGPGVRIRQQCRTPRAPRSDRPGCRTLAWSTTSSWAKRRVARSGKMETLAIYTQDTPLIQTLEIAPSA